jgi:hypothetical protein
VLSVALCAERSLGLDVASTSTASWQMFRQISVAPASSQGFTRRETLFFKSLEARESEVPERLAASTGGQSLSVQMGSSGTVSAPYHHEGTAGALAEDCRVTRRLPARMSVLFLTKTA